MPSPFPGMNPYLERPDLWPEVHSRLLVALADALNPQLLPRYRAALDRRVYRLDGQESLLVGIPDVTVEGRSTTQPFPSAAKGELAAPPASAAVAVLSPAHHPLSVQVPMALEVRETYLEIQATATQEVITAVELLSPANKRTGTGRSVYEAKRQQILASRSHFVEIDLLRAGEPMALLGPLPISSYRILVSRSENRPQADLYGWNLPDTLPTFPLPLRSGDLEPEIDLKSLLDQVYDRAGYHFVLDYTLLPTPPFSATEQTWLQEYQATLMES